MTDVNLKSAIDDTLAFSHDTSFFAVREQLISWLLVISFTSF
jgi:hypothetical protein